MELYLRILLFQQFITIQLALPTENLNFERIIDNYDDMIRGVYLDFSYNETATSGHFPSAPGCPKSEAGIPWVYYGSPTKCYLAGEPGPCKSYQKLFVEVGSTFGICNCECFENQDGLTINKLQFCSGKGRDFVFDPEFKKCFQFYDQGPCKENEWLVKVAGEASDFSVRCEARTCPVGKRPNMRNFGDPCIFFPYFSLPPTTRNDCNNGHQYNERLNRCVKNPPGIFMTS